MPVAGVFTTLVAGAFTNAMERKQWANRLCQQESLALGDIELQKQQPVWLGQRPTVVIDDPEQLTQDTAEIEVPLRAMLLTAVDGVDSGDWVLLHCYAAEC